jgi:hypothetical protein
VGRRTSGSRVPCSAESGRGQQTSRWRPVLDLGRETRPVMMKTTEVQGLGGRWALPTIPAMPDESIVKVGEALAHQPGRFSGAFGRLCLTSQRLIWNPSSLYRWLRIEEPIISLLAELEGCKSANRAYGTASLLFLKQRKGRSGSIYTAPRFSGQEPCAGQLQNGRGQ